MPSTTPKVSTSLVLARPGTPINKKVAARQERNQGLIDDILLAINDPADGSARGPQLGAQPLDVGQGGESIGVGRGRSVWGHRGAPVVRGIKGQGSPELRPEQGHDG